MTPTLRPYLPADFDTVSLIYVDSIAELTEDDYTESQRAAWIAQSQDEDAFAAQMEAALTIIAEFDGAAVGFATLKDNKTIVMLYVHPEHVRLKVGTTLVDALERIAAGRGVKEITIDSSDTAEPFFKGRGYTARQRNTVQVDDEWMGNTTMTRDLSAITVGHA